MAVSCPHESRWDEGGHLLSIEFVVTFQFFLRCFPVSTGKNILMVSNMLPDFGI